MLYRILTENKNEHEICELVSSYFPGFTIYDAHGYWQDKRECTLIIEISATNDMELGIRALCNHIRELNDQGCVLLQQIECKESFI